MNTPALKQRLLAIMAADAVGYSLLMADDERATVQTLDAARAVFRMQIEANQGRVIDMAGDSVLATFEIAAGAVMAALAIQQQLDAADADAGLAPQRCMRFRIGVHLGDVVEKPDGTVYGDGVNIAARLQGLAEPGGLIISDAVQGAVRGKLAAGLIDLGEQRVKNIGHPVRAYRVRPDGGAAAPPTAQSDYADLELPDKPSIAVLPFDNMSGDAEQAYFTDGITEDIITELSRFHSLFVIARNSTFSYKGKAVDVRSVARELGVRYVVEGSIRRAANRIRVTAQLIDARTAHHLWAEKYDRVLEDIFAVQEEVTRAIVAAIAPHIESSEAARTRGARPGNLTAYAIAMRAWAAAQVGFGEANRETRDDAIRYAHEALAIDPNCSTALRTLVWAQWQHVYYNTAESRAEAIEEGLSAAQRAIVIDYGDHAAHLWKGLLTFMSGQSEVGMNDVRRAHELNPNDALTLCYLGYFEAMFGVPQKGIDYVLEGMRLSPRDPSRFHYLNCLGWANFALADHAAGAEWSRQSIDAAPKMPAAYVCLALHLVGLGEITQAKAKLEIVRAMAPELVSTRLDGNWNFVNPLYRHKATTFLRVACGLDDPVAAQACH